MARIEESNFMSANGTTMVNVVKWIPDNGMYDAILQISHGMCEHIMRYNEFANYATEHGIMVVGNSHIGHGKSVNSSDDYGFFGNHPSDIVVEDMHKLRKMTQDEKPYFLMGHSMGSYMLRKYLAIHGNGISGAIIMGTGYVSQPVITFGIVMAKLQGFVMGKKYRSELLRKLSYTKSYNGFESYGKDNTKSWLTREVNEVKKYFSDPMCTFTFTCNGYLGLFEAVKFSCLKENAELIPKDMPIFIMSGDNDPVGDLSIGVKKVETLYKSVGIKNVKCKLYHEDRHEILHETDKKVVFHDIVSWIKATNANI